MLFKEKKELLSLFNEINETDYSNPDDLVINTLENAIYMSMKNDNQKGHLRKEENIVTYAEVYCFV